MSRHLRRSIITTLAYQSSSDVDLLARDSGLGERLDLAVEILLDRRHAGIPEIHQRNVPDVAVARVK